MSDLTPRQEIVLRAVVSAYVGVAAPVGSRLLSSLLPVSLSSATIRNTMSELAERGLIDKPHASAGRVPTEQGLRLFVDELLHPSNLVDYERRALADAVECAEQPGLMRAASKLLSTRTGLLGFVVAPRIDRLVLRHITLVRLSTEKVLAVLVSGSGITHQCVVDEGRLDDRDLARVARALNERLGERTLRELRDALEAELRALRESARRVVEGAIALCAQLDGAIDDPVELIVASSHELLGQPEFHDAERVRELFQAVELSEDLTEFLDRILESPGVSVAFGNEVGEPGLRRCALVSAPYGIEPAPLGRLGVIGPSRMDYGRVIALVGYLSDLITAKLAAA